MTEIAMSKVVAGLRANMATAERLRAQGTPNVALSLLWISLRNVPTGEVEALASVEPADAPLLGRAFGYADQWTMHYIETAGDSLDAEALALLRQRQAEYRVAATIYGAIGKSAGHPGAPIDTPSDVPNVEPGTPMSLTDVLEGLRVVVEYAEPHYTRPNVAEALSYIAMMGLEGSVREVIDGVSAADLDTELLARAYAFGIKLTDDILNFSVSTLTSPIRMQAIMANAYYMVQARFFGDAAREQTLFTNQPDVKTVETGKPNTTLPGEE